jgi:sugar phosphate permease
LVGEIYPEMAGTAIGSIKVAIPVGGILIPAMMSLLSRQTTLQWSLAIFPGVLLVAFGVLLAAFREMPAAKGVER